MLTLLQKISRALVAHRLDRIRGVRRVLLFCFYALRPSGEATLDIAEGKVRVDLADRGQIPYLYLFGAYDESEVEILRVIIQPGMSVADIGANFGYFTLLMSHLVGPEGRVYAFEPESHAYDMLKETIRLNGLANVTAVKAGVGDRAGSARLFLDRKNLGNPSLSEKNIPTTARGGAEDIEMVTLDAYMGQKKLDAIKIDVQGAEGAAFRGGRETIKRFQPVIFTEFWPHGLRNLGTDPKEFVRFLESAGLRCALVHAQSGSLKDVTPDTAVGIERNRPNGMGWANMLCRKR
ncbi:MAG: FkbM family methyltransferase [Candidatus Sungbacteria bacterium]|nr:FkbM family methyltransferase [Candidatus Sungbacteria bacterium]